MTNLNLISGEWIRGEGKDDGYRAGQFHTYAAVIWPWNVPTTTASCKIALAPFHGDAVTWRPANVTPASAVALTEIIESQDNPQRLFPRVMGSGRKVGQRLDKTARDHAISFAGPVPVGKGASCDAPLATVNGTSFSRTSGIVTHDPARATHLRRTAKTVYITAGTPS